METTPRTKLNLKSAMAIALIGVGAVAAFSYLGLLGFQVRALLNGSLSDSLGSFVGMGLAVLHSLQSAAFERGAFLSFSYKILVLFSAFGALATGMALLRGRGTVTGNPFNQNTEAQHRGGRQ
jgi:hypothetical protein